VANAVAAVYQYQNLSRKRDVSADALTWLREEGGGMRDRLLTSERKLQEFMEDSQVFSFDEKFNIALRNLAKFSEAHAESKRKRIELEALYHKCVEMQSKGQADLIPDVMNNPVVQALKSERIAAQQKLAELSKKWGEKHPEILALKEQIDLLNSKIAQEAAQHIGSIKASYQVAKSQEDQMAIAVDEARAQAQELSEKEISYKELKRDADANQTLYEELQKRAKETQITESLQANNIMLIEAAQRPDTHVRPKRRVNVILGALLGLIGGVGLAFFLEYLDNTIKTQADIESVTNEPFLGVIPTFQPEEGDTSPADLFTHYHPKSSITESCRAIRTNILYSSPGKNLTKLLVTSAGPQEGKSTTVVSLGTVFAQGGRRVCLVDSDLRRPRLHRAFGTDRARGLTNYIVGEAGLDEIITATPVPNVSLIASGPIPPNPSELLESEPMSRLMAELEERFDLIVFDSPPIVAVTDAIVLSRRVDGVVLVAKAGKTTTDIFSRALRQLEDVKSHVIGTVLNDFNIRGEGYRYYYYYHYYRSDEDAASDPSRRRRVKKKATDETRKSA
jgi:capsular exopolysaccharide synthesis family protein